MAAVASPALLCRWEEVLLADTLRFSLDPAVARAKRVLHLGGLEGELREEEKEGGWYVFFVFFSRQHNKPISVHRYGSRIVW